MKYHFHFSSRGSLLLDFMMALAFGITFMIFTKDLVFLSRQLVEQSKQNKLDIQEYDLAKDRMTDTSTGFITSSSTTIVSSKFGNYFYKNYFIGSNKLYIENIFGNDQSIINDPKDLCNPQLLRNYKTGSYDSYRLLGASSSPLVDIDIRTISLPLNITDFPTDFVIRNGFAYITLDSNDQIEPDLISVDIRDDPGKIISSQNSGPGLSGLLLVGDRIYASSLSTTNQLQIFGLGQGHDLHLIAKYKLPLPYATATPPLGSAIDFSYPNIILGTTKWDGDELSLISIDQDIPSKISGFDIGSKINNIYSADRALFVSSSNQYQLSNFIINNNFLNLTKYLDPGGSNRQEGKVTNLFENNLLFGRTSGGFDIDNEHELFRFGSSSPIDTNQYISTNQSGGIYGLIEDKDYIYAISHKKDAQFIIYDKNLKIFDNYSLPINPLKLRCDGNLLYILANNAPYIYEIKISKK